MNNTWTDFSIEGTQVSLRYFTTENITQKYIDWLNDKELMKFSNQRFRTHKIESCINYLDSFIGSDNLFLAIYHNDEYIGTMNAYVSKIHKTADIGLLIGVESQGRGLGLDSWLTFMGYLFQNEIRKVTGGTLRCNTAMIKIMTRSGMNPDGIRIAQELVNGKAEDILHFAKFSI